MAAVSFARSAPGVVAVSMSWGRGEYAGETGFDARFTTPAGHPGVTFLAASGDDGAPGIYPAMSPNVVAVGGTSLTLSKSGTAQEKAWSGSGGGQSQQESRPSWQAGVVPATLTKRAIPDVSLVADPGYPVYAGGPLIAAAASHSLPLLPANGFQPDLDAVPGDVAARVDHDRSLALVVDNLVSGEHRDFCLFVEQLMRTLVLLRGKQEVERRD